ncbi:hypothetical protein Tco_0024401 [Tanacetum coccineum]
MSVADSGALNQGMVAPSHIRRRVQKEKRCLKGWKKVCSTGSGIKEKVCPCTQMTQGVEHTTVATETRKAATKVFIQKKQNPFLRNVITKGRPIRKWRSYHFTPRIRYFDFPKTRMPSYIKIYDGSEDLEDHLKIFQSAAKTERWAMPTWCHMFNSILTGNARVWFDDLPKETIDSYDDLKKAFLENYLQ